MDTDSCQTPAQTRPQPSDVAATRAAHRWSAEEADFCPPVMKQVNITGSLDERKHQNADSFKGVAARLQAPVVEMRRTALSPQRSHFSPI